MTEFLKSDLKILAQRRASPSVTITFPTHREFPERDKNTIRFDNAVREVWSLMDRRGTDERIAGGILASLEALRGDAAFWNAPQEGMTVLASAGFLRHFVLPYRVEERVEAADYFALSSLLLHAEESQEFYVLALSQGHVELFYGTREAVGPVEVKAMPKSFAEAMQTHDHERRMQCRGGPPSASGSALKGGGLMGDELKKKETERFVERVEAGVRAELAGSEAPLILAGIPWVLAFYRRHNGYAHLAQDDIEHNVDRWDRVELHRRAWEIVTHLFEGRRRERLAAYDSAVGAGRTVNMLGDLLPATPDGRVDILFVRRGAESVRGTFDAERGRMEVRGSGPRHGSDAADENLIERAITETLAHGGAAYTLDGAVMPSPTAVCAILRY